MKLVVKMITDADESMFDNNTAWMLQKREDEEAIISIKSYIDSIHLRDSNGNALEGVTIVCDTLDDVVPVYDSINAAKAYMENEYPELKSRELIEAVDHYEE